jgi:hypothetical protein
MTHSLFANQGEGRDKIGEEQQKQPVAVLKKAALMESGAREGIRPLVTVIQAVK